LAAALMSSLSGVPVPHDMILFGEVGLSGEIRNVGQLDTRLKEASKLGFKHATIPYNSKTKIKIENLKINQIRHIRDIVPLFTEEN